VRRLRVAAESLRRGVAVDLLSKYGAVGWYLDMQSRHAIKPENAWMSCGGQLPIQRDSAALKGAIRPRE
jgi:hypothetical protein